MKPETILIIEDSRANMMLTSLVLEKSGYAVLKASTAKDGIALAHTELPVLILMDIQLPGMNGLEATAELKADARTRAIPIVAITAHAMSGDEKKILAAGCDAYLSKPLRHQTLLACVRTYLATPGSTE